MSTDRDNLNKTVEFTLLSFYKKQILKDAFVEELLTINTTKTFEYRRLLHIHAKYRVFIKYCVFSLKCCDFYELCQFCSSAGVHRGKAEKYQSPEYFKI